MRVLAARSLVDVRMRRACRYLQLFTHFIVEWPTNTSGPRAAAPRPELYLPATPSAQYYGGGGIQCGGQRRSYLDCALDRCRHVEGRPVPEGVEANPEWEGWQDYPEPCCNLVMLQPGPPWRARVRARMPTRMRAHSGKHTHASTHTHTHTCTRMHTRIHKYTRTQNTHTQSTHGRARARAHTHTHTLTHTCLVFFV